MVIAGCCFALCFLCKCWHKVILCKPDYFFICLKPQTALFKPCRSLSQIFHSCMTECSNIHPVLVPPREQQQHLHLAAFARPCIVGTMVALLDAAFAQKRFTLLMCGYGQKFPAKDFFEHRHLGKHLGCECLFCVVVYYSCLLFPGMCSEQLRIRLAIHDVQVSSLSSDEKATYLNNVVIDFGWQHNLSGQPVVAWPLGTLGTEEPLTWVKLSKADCYSAFGKLGRGMGGYTIKAKKENHGPPEGMSILQAKSYCGAWVHFLKAQGMPPLTVNKSSLE